MPACARFYPQDRALRRGHFFRNNVHPASHQGELERLSGTRLPEVKALWARRGNPSCWIYALPEPTPFKSQLDTMREKKHKSKNRAVKENIHGCRCCCSAEWKIIWCNKWYARDRPALSNHSVCMCTYGCMRMCNPVSIFFPLALQ